MDNNRCSAYYTATVNQESDYPELEGDIRVDVAIVGGGYSYARQCLGLGVQHQDDLDCQYLCDP